jgi:hypothetical protein
MEDGERFRLEYRPNGGAKNPFETSRGWPAVFKVTFANTVLGQIRGGVPVQYQFPEYEWDPSELASTGRDILRNAPTRHCFHNDAFSLRFEPKGEDVKISIPVESVLGRAHPDPRKLPSVEVNREYAAFQFYGALVDIFADAERCGATRAADSLREYVEEIKGDDSLRGLFTRFGKTLP